MSATHWQVTEGAEMCRVELVGVLDEQTDLNQLLSQLEKNTEIELNLSGVERINSCGVRAWINFIKELASTREVSLVRCSPPMVSQINMISNFVGDASIRSIVAPFVCERCGATASAPVDVTGGEPVELPTPRCGACDEDMGFDELREGYFAFLSH